MRILTIKDWAIIGLCLLSALSGTLWLRARDARMRAEGRYEIQIAIADSLRSNADSLRTVADSVRHVKDSVIAHEDPRIATANRERDRAVAKANEAQSRMESIARAIGTRAGPDSAVARRAAAEAVDSVLNQVVAPLRFALTRADSVALSLTRENTALKESLSRTEAALSATTAALDARVAADENLPKTEAGFVARNIEKAAYVIGGAVVGYFVANLRR